MSSVLFPNLLPERPHAFWIFLGVAISIFLASLGLKAPLIAEDIAHKWHQENPIALTDLSACATLKASNLQNNFHKQFPSWSLTPLKESDFAAPQELGNRIDLFFTLAPRKEDSKTLKLFEPIKTFLRQNCAEMSLATLPEAEQNAIGLKASNLESNASKLSYLLTLTSLALCFFSLFILVRARFELPLSRLLLFGESSLSAFKIGARTINILNFSVLLGTFSGVFFSDLFSAYFSANFFERPLIPLFCHMVLEEIRAVKQLSFTPDIILLLTTLSLYVVILLFFLFRLDKKLNNRRKVRIFLSDNNPFN
ncbi:hypothetical protein FAI40_02120 [Acetobacteraceae bacterium]|nr:hypothetical protein FAI40_02120 [Acetobacteraceae bacterium]